MKMHKWIMSFTMQQRDAVNKVIAHLTEQRVSYKAEFDFEKKRITLLFEYPAKKYNSAIKQLNKCFN